MDFFKKIQNLNIKAKKIILWTIAAFLGIIFLIIWLKITALRFRDFNNSGALDQIKKPEIEIPTIEIPNFFETYPTLPSDSFNPNQL